jgi:chromosome segregation ATPase
MQLARNEQTSLAARIEELEQQLVSALTDERRLIDIADKTRLELNDTRKALRSCTEQCQHLQESLLAAHEDKEVALACVSQAAAQRALTEAQQFEDRMAEFKAAAEAETKRCVRDAAKKLAQDMTDSETQVSEYTRRIDDLQTSLVERRRELKVLERQLADERAETEAKVAKAVMDTEAKVKMTIKGLKKDLSDANALIAEHKRQCAELQNSLFQAQQVAKASETAAASAAAAANAHQEAVIRNFQDELEAQRALHSAEMQLADTEHAALAMRVYELEIAAAQAGRSKSA